MFSLCFFVVACSQFEVQELNSEIYKDKTEILSERIFKIPENHHHYILWLLERTAPPTTTISLFGVFLSGLGMNVLEADLAIDVIESK